MIYPLVQSDSCNLQPLATVLQYAYNQTQKDYLSHRLSLNDHAMNSIIS